VRPETRINCSQCGEATTVPFKPTQGRPVLCRSCFKQQMPQDGAAPVPPSRPEPTPEQQHIEGD
jgi:CxxC-x17-CxxC domain-containing protein